MHIGHTPRGRSSAFTGSDRLVLDSGPSASAGLWDQLN